MLGFASLVFFPLALMEKEVAQVEDGRRRNGGQIAEESSGVRQYVGICTRPIGRAGWDPGSKFYPALPSNLFTALPAILSDFAHTSTDRHHSTASTCDFPMRCKLKPN
ncbi:hypothetical protein K461DRAFT_69054 [Myriangium duriaei CBS 260.36]|uniref:Secreted protein n=1 Tax=Myriangium duriaei CBS 260.36 TaxID=1168546 RepID=A0A9P4IUL9_9PEZI|nr:hypothetical protein K461DRAFT_69054 [Myriangium duriaei CBS 260.36]